MSTVCYVQMKALVDVGYDLMMNGINGVKV